MMTGKLTYFDSGFKIEGTYNENHTEDDCDRCFKNIGKYNLKYVPFLLLHINDKVHEDATRNTIDGKKNLGYRHYRVCNECYREVV